MRILNLVLLLILVSAISAFSGEDKQDVIYFKNTNVVKGDVVEVIAGEIVRIKLANGIIYTYSMNEVLRIEFALPPKPKVVTSKVPKIENAPPPMEVTMPSKPKNPAYKSPGLAFLLSFLIVGTGQYYNGDVQKGVAQQGLFGFGLLLILSDDDKGYKLNYSGRQKSPTSQQRIGAWIALGAGIWSIIDAPVSASKKNKKWKYENTFGHLMEFDSGKQIVGFDLGYSDKILGGKVTLHF